MKAVWKLNLVPGRNSYLLPKGAKIISAGMQFGRPRCWFLIDPHTSNQETRELVLVGTGHMEVPDGAKFVGTMMTDDGGNLVLHLFEMPRDG